jgi:hypothetical protein
MSVGRTSLKPNLGALIYFVVHANGGISMAVEVMHVGRVRMIMLQRLMLVRVGVRLSGRILGPVCMLMVLVMRVSHRLVNMLVFVMLGDVQPDTQGHERSGREEPARPCESDCCPDPRPRKRRQSQAGLSCRQTWVRLTMKQVQHQRRGTAFQAQCADQSSRGIQTTRSAL